MRAIDAVSIVGQVQTRVALSGSVAASSALPAGTYQALSNVDCFIQCAVTAATAVAGLASTTGFPLLAGNGVPVLVPEGFFVGAITAGGTGTLILFPVGGAS